jgi:hypothetical protein
MEVHEPELCTLQETSAEMQEYYDWARDNGIEWLKLHYPAVFPPGYIGTVASEEIGPHESVIKVPNHMILSYKLAAASDLMPIFDQYPELFSASHYDHEDLTLISYLIKERSKGRGSFWFPFIQVLPQTVEVLYDWEAKEMKELQDPDLLYDAKTRLIQNLRLWREWRSALQRHPEAFSDDMLKFESFHWALKLIVTRCFGKYSPSTSFCPIAELLNHSNSQTVYIYGDDSAKDLRSFTHFAEDEDQDDLYFEPEDFIYLSCKQLLNLLGVASRLDGLVKERLKSEAVRLDCIDADHCELYSAFHKQQELSFTESLEETESSCLRIQSGAEVYRRGSQVCLSYGRYSSRHLLSYYGFLLPDNKFDYARLKLRVEALTHNSQLKERLRQELDCFVMFKVKSSTVCSRKS